MLDIKVKRTREITVVECAGRLCAGANLSRLREATMAEPVASSLILDLSQITAIDAAGLGTLVALHTAAQRLGSELKLCLPSTQVEAMLALTGLDSIFAICSARDGNGPHTHVKAATCA